MLDSRCADKQSSELAVELGVNSIAAQQKYSSNAEAASGFERVAQLQNKPFLEMGGQDL